VAAVDSSAEDPVEVLIQRAGSAVAAVAIRMLGGAYGRRVVVVAGKGNNGNDGRAAAGILASRGVRVLVLDAGSLGARERLPVCDLVIDAAYGTGFRGSYHPPDTAGAPVLAVDIPSDISGDTGLAGDDGAAVRADVTVAFAALKPGHLIGNGPDCCGTVEVVDIGLGDQVASEARSWVVEDGDVASALPRRPRDAHKWQSAVQVVAGSPGMMGAPVLAGRGAMRSGAGYVRMAVPGADLASLPAGEWVGTPLPATAWEGAALEAAARVKAMVVGPGLGRSQATADAVCSLLDAADVPTVLDADGIFAVGSVARLRSLAVSRPRPIVITPHAEEYRRLTGEAPGADRIASVRETAQATGTVVLLKGSCTIVAEPMGRVLLAVAGSARLATAGTGDVLSGIIGAFLARGLDGLEAAAFAAHVHGRAAANGRSEGLVAGDLPDLVSCWLSEAMERRRGDAPRGVRGG
jgi:NAD(P)H-hydrate epimerase